MYKRFVVVRISRFHESLRLATTFNSERMTMIKIELLNSIANTLLYKRLDQNVLYIYTIY